MKCPWFFLEILIIFFRFGNNGCYGGFPEAAFEYIRQNGGIDTEQSYPYEEIDGRCRYSPENKGATDTGFRRLPSRDENALKYALANIGPISVLMDSLQGSFQFYRRGIYYDKNCNERSLNHAVLAVGYGTENGHDYYIVKNSWGSKTFFRLLDISSQLMNYFNGVI